MHSGHHITLECEPSSLSGCHCVTDFDRYQYLDDQKQNVQQALAASPDKSFEGGLKIKTAAFGGEASLPWIYHNDIEKVWEKYLADGTESNGTNSFTTPPLIGVTA